MRSDRDRLRDLRAIDNPERLKDAGKDRFLWDDLALLHRLLQGYTVHAPGAEPGPSRS
jgi:hypothetical protein